MNPAQSILHKPFAKVLTATRDKAVLAVREVAGALCQPL